MLKGTVQWELRGVKIGISRSIIMSSLAGKCPLPCPKGHHHERSTFSAAVTVKSGNFVTFFAQNFFSTKFNEGTLYFFLAVNSLKKWCRCWHGHFLPRLTFKPVFFKSSSGDEITLLEGNFVSHLYPWTKTWIWTPAGNFFSWKFFVKNLGTHTKW